MLFIDFLTACAPAYTLESSSVTKTKELMYEKSYLSTRNHGHCNNLLVKTAKILNLPHLPFKAALFLLQTCNIVTFGIIIKKCPKSLSGGLKTNLVKCFGIGISPQVGVQIFFLGNFYFFNEK